MDFADRDYPLITTSLANPMRAFTEFTFTDQHALDTGNRLLFAIAQTLPAE